MLEKIPVWFTVQDNCPVPEQVDDNVWSEWLPSKVTDTEVWENTVPKKPGQEEQVGLQHASEATEPSRSELSSKYSPQNVLQY